jgi:FMN phosphatase YigB (HAD superfamily)
MSTLKKINVVSFDALGTLFHPRHPIGRLYAEYAARFGVKRDATQVEHAFGQVMRERWPSYASGGHWDAKLWWHSVVLRGVDNSRVDGSENVPRRARLVAFLRRVL